MTVLLVGGSGLIGQALELSWLESGCNVLILSRNPKRPNHVFWDPETKQIDLEPLRNVNVIVNLSGAGIADKKWSSARKKELIESRVNATVFLFESLKPLNLNLKSYIGISGINAFGFNTELVHHETSPFGTDFLSVLVQDWELAHKHFETICPCSILRLGMVITHKGGAIKKMSAPIKMGFGAIPAPGSQISPWIHIDDVVGLIKHLSNTPFRLVHGVSAQNTLAEITHRLAETWGKKIWLPKIPRFMLQFLLGDLSILITGSLRVSTKSLADCGYQSTITNLEIALPLQNEKN